MKKIGLVLQGGGALGAYQVGVIRRLMEKKLKPHIVSGVSIGGVNAATLCAPRNGNPVTSLEAVWREFTLIDFPVPVPFASEGAALFGNPGMYQPRMDYYDMWRWTGFYDNAPLARTLEKHVDFDRLRPGTDAPRLVLTATNIRTGNLDVFDSHEMPIRAEHVLASGSLPPGLKAAHAHNAQGEEQLYWDGGLCDNTPLEHVINRLETRRDRVDSLVVVNLVPKHGDVPGDMLQVFDRMVEIIFAGKLFRDTRVAERIKTLVEFREHVEKALPLISESLPRTAVDAKRSLNELLTHEGFKLLTQWFSVFDKIIEIENSEHEPINALSDFSGGAIRRRQEAGYRDACVMIP